MEKYISDADFKYLITDVQEKLQNQQIEECQEMLQQILRDSEQEKQSIDMNYIRQVKAQKRKNRISEINTMLLNMSDNQVENVHHYAVDEYDEPNHEVEALKVIMHLSRKK